MRLATAIRSHTSNCVRLIHGIAAGLTVGLVLLVGCGSEEEAGTKLNGGRSNGPLASESASSETPFIQVLGIGQDGGVPQAGNVFDSRWSDPKRQQLVSSLALVDPASSSFWLFDATPDFPEQLRASVQANPPDTLTLEGVFLTHAHIGHYTGLMYLGHEAMGAVEVPVYAMPRMSEFLATNGPWNQLVRYKNIELRELASGSPIDLPSGLSVSAFLVPHRQEYAEVVGYRIKSSKKSLLFIPDIDSWEELAEAGPGIEAMIADVDYALIDGTFFENGELPKRNMSGFPHPFIRTSMDRFGSLSLAERSKIYFIHLNHSNPALDGTSIQRRELQETGMHIAAQGLRLEM